MNKGARQRIIFLSVHGCNVRLKFIISMWDYLCHPNDHVVISLDYFRILIRSFEVPFYIRFKSRKLHKSPYGNPICSERSAHKAACSSLSVHLNANELEELDDELLELLFELEDDEDDLEELLDRDDEELELDEELDELLDDELRELLEELELGAVQFTVFEFTPPELVTEFPPLESMSVAVTLETDWVPEILRIARLPPVVASRVHDVAVNNPLTINV